DHIDPAESDFLGRAGCGEFAMRCQKQGQRCDILSCLYPLWGMFRTGDRILGRLQKPDLHPVYRTLRDA
ncbi:hypothetical protein, partial [Tychonema sp. LEGE 07203]|uniref:hypothetical protein n=1 Tax=Tychonema sp. LEGE 07203 TaxID=1828671 RepID=UPI00187F6560